MTTFQGRKRENAWTFVFHPRNTSTLCGDFSGRTAPPSRTLLPTEPHGPDTPGRGPGG